MASYRSWFLPEAGTKAEFSPSSVWTRSAPKDRINHRVGVVKMSWVPEPVVEKIRGNAAVRLCETTKSPKG